MSKRTPAPSRSALALPRPLRPTALLALASALGLCAACQADPGPAAQDGPPAIRLAPLQGDASDPFALAVPGSASKGLTAVQLSHFFRLTVPANQAGLRIAVRANGPVDLLLHQDAAAGPIVASAYDAALETLFRTQAETAGSTWYVEVSADQATTYDLAVEPTYARALTWDPGTTLAGTQLATRPTGGFGDFLYTLTARNTVFGAWRSVLRVTAGEADLLIANNTFPVDYAQWSSTAAGSDAVLLGPNEFTANDVWQLRVRAGSGDANWTLLSGDVFVQDLGALAATSSNATVTPDVFGHAYFKTQVAGDALAWRLAAPGATLYLNDATAPIPRRSDTWDLTASDETLVVPPILTSGQYLVAVETAAPISIDSRRQQIIDAPNNGFQFTANGSAATYGYVTYKLTVPVDQIAWEVAVTPGSGGHASLYVGHDAVPSEYQNGGMSEVAGVTNTITQVPPSLTNGTWYVTVRGEPPFDFTLTSGNPTVTDMAFVTDPGTVANGAAFEDQVGWRYYRVPDIVSQVGTLGWILDLANQVPGTEIAIRKNALPGRWSYRTRSGGQSYEGATQHFDAASTAGFLERPNHEADIWYIGIYQGAEALGPFTLRTRTFQPTTLTFEGGTQQVVAQPSGRWRYFKVTVPAAALGWDLRLNSVTSGTPRMVVRSEILPPDFSIVPGYPGPIFLYDHWDSGWQWAPANDLTHRPYRIVNGNVDNPVDDTGRYFLAATGAPLRQGVFYVGVSDLANNGTAPMSYTLASRGLGIGASYSLPVADLAFSGGTATVTGLAPRELRAYRVVVPATESWALELNPTAGEAMMAIAKDHLPNAEAGTYGYDSVSVTGTRRQKAGTELFYRYPGYGETTLTAGTWYVLVAAEGTGADGSTIGTGSTSYTITSRGNQTVKGGATTTVDDQAPLAFHGESLRYGEQCAYRFTVPDGVSSVEVRLTPTSGHPTFTVADATAPFPAPTQTCNGRGGGSYVGADDTIVTLQAPRGVHTVLVSANTQYDDLGAHDVGAGFDLDIVARGEAVLPFNGGDVAVQGQESQTWRYFQVVVPDGALGWDLHLRNVTGGTPRMVIRRNDLPTDFSTTYFGGYSSLFDFDHWDSGWTWAPSYDLTSRPYGPYSDLGGAVDESGRHVQMGMGSPLEPGTYYVGVADTWSGASGEPMSYELVSRGIGIGDDAAGAPWLIQVADLDFAAGTATATLDPREVGYYRVVVPEDATSWEVELDPTVGEAALALRLGSLPNAQASVSYPADAPYTFAGTKRQKTGDEYFYRYPDSGMTTIPGGTFYLAVASEGQDTVYDSYIGVGPTTFTLRSKGAIDIRDAAAPLSDGPIHWDGESLHYGEQRSYRFVVPSGTTSMEVRLEHVGGHPYATVGHGDGTLPAPSTTGYTAHQGGESYEGSDESIVTVAEPDGTYVVTVTGGYGPPDYQAADSSYDLVVEAVGEDALAMNGGQISVTDQPTQTWRYFRVHVPADALGWDLRLANVTTGHPKMVIRRDALPEDFSTTYLGYNASIYDLDHWDSGWTWSPSADLTQRPYGVYDPDTGAALDESGRHVSMGMGAPLEPGDYVVGVSDVFDPYTLEPMSYRIESRGIGKGQDGANKPWVIQVKDITFGQTVTETGVAPREAVYYRMTVPAGLESWGATLTPTAGESMMAVRRGAIPNAQARQDGYYPIASGAGQRRQKPGADFFYELPQNGETAVEGGVHYIAVAAEGQGAYSTSYLGTGPSSWTLSTSGPVPIAGGTDKIVAPGSQPVIFAAQTQPWGAIKVFRVRVTPDVRAFEIRLRNKVGGPVFAASVDPYFAARVPTPSQPYYYAAEGGAPAYWQGEVADQIVGQTGDVTIAVASTAQPTVVDATYDLVITPLAIGELGWNGGHVQANLEDQGAAYYHVTVPQDCDGVAQAGWIVTQTTQAGAVQVRVRPGALPGAPPTPGSNGLELATSSKQTIIVPPFLEPGDWYVSVEATGTAIATIDTAEVKEARHWTMPKKGETANVPGLTHPVFGDSGVLDDGSPVVNQGSGDQGVDLAEGTFRFYRVTVPAGNAGLMRTRIEAISGDPDLYIRRGAAPTLNQIPGNPYYRTWDYADQLEGSSYGHWVPPDARYGTELEPGEYWLGVYAQGSNVRYRLKIDLGIVSTLALTNGNATGQALAAGDMRYYQVQIPQTSVNQAQSTPIDWKLTFTQQQGDAAVFLRESVPPGLFAEVPQPGVGVDTYLRDWNGDRGAYVYDLPTLPVLEATGQTTLSLPVVRPNTTYWLGVYARTDVVFDLASAVGATRQQLTGVLAFAGGSINVDMAAGARRLYRVDVPADAARWIHTATVPDGVNLYLSQGLIPPATSYADWNNYGASYASDLTVSLLAPDGYTGNYPWVPGESYYLLVSNDSGATAHVDLTMDGRKFDDDSDGDALPDGWELEYFGSLSYDGATDYESDGLSNAQELALGTDPRDRDSDHDELDDSAELYSGGDPLVPDTDHDQVCDGSDSAPDDPTESGPVIRLTMGQMNTGSYGAGHGTNQHPTRLVAIFDRSDVKSHWLHLTGWDIESADEVQVSLNGMPLGYLPVGGNNVASIPVVWWIDSTRLVNGTNRLELRQKTRGEPWGVDDLGLFTFGQSFGYDATQAYDTHHPKGFDIRWPAPLPDVLLEIRGFDLEAANDVTVTMDGTKLFDPFPASANLAWGRYWQIPILGSDYPQAGDRVISVRPRAGSDGQYQFRVVDCRPLLSTFGSPYGIPGEGNHAADSLNVLVPEKSERRELVLGYTATDGGGIARAGTLATPPSVWPALANSQPSPPQLFFSEIGATDTLTLDRVEPAEADFRVFGVAVQYYGPCRDTDFDQVDDCADAFPIEGDEWDDVDHDQLGDNWERQYFGTLTVATTHSDIDQDGKDDLAEFVDRDDPACADLDGDTYLGATQYCPRGNDCDDHNSDIGPGANDNDCDGVPTALDCDDHDGSIGASAGDQDCDHVATALDCDDQNPALGARANDQDCDGVLATVDCDDHDPSVGASARTTRTATASPPPTTATTPIRPSAAACRTTRTATAC
ncbi:MAG: hypothetical protein U1F43_30890 [Myxococcota bacterium]